MVYFDKPKTQKYRLKVPISEWYLFRRIGIKSIENADLGEYPDLQFGRLFNSLCDSSVVAVSPNRRKIFSMQ